MDSFGDLFGGLGDMLGGLFGEGAGAEGVEGLASMLMPENGRDERQPMIVYERFLCGGPRQLDINDR